MSEEASPSGDLIIRKSNLASDHASLRLVTRGLLALDTPQTVFLEVHDLIAFQSSVFILSKDWDACYDDICNMTDSWKAKRRLVLYEFHRTGVFVRKIAMPLLHFTQEGYGHIHKRFPGKVTIRSGFIHFYENLNVYPGPSDADERPIRVDYLYGRNGERRAIWSNDEFVDRNRQHREPTVPIVDWLQPEWADGTRLIALYPLHGSQGNLPPLTGTTTDACHYTHTSEYLIVSQDADQLVTHITALQENLGAESATAIIGLDEHVHSKVVFPLPTALSLGNRHAPCWSHTTSDPQSIWFVKNQANGITTSVWKIELSGNMPVLTTYSLPHPYDLIRQGVFTVCETHGDMWSPSEADYQKLNRIVAGEYRDRREYAYLFYEFKYESIVSSGDYLLISISGQGERLDYFRNVLLLCKAEAGGLHIIKELDPAQIHIDALSRRWDAMSDSRQSDSPQKEERWTSEVWNPYLAHPSSDVLDHE